MLLEQISVVIQAFYLTLLLSTTVASCKKGPKSNKPKRPSDLNSARLDLSLPEKSGSMIPVDPNGGKTTVLAPQKPKIKRIQKKLPKTDTMTNSSKEKVASKDNKTSSKDEEKQKEKEKIKAISMSRSDRDESPPHKAEKSGSSLMQRPDWWLGLLF
ncbi:unnamed protein product, partial [Mesorhabditis belari]|uniref:Uncharacterized protein n=1 Tax=Mesorhabditis belari TaxID=2138241 RepID=A0AAF3F6M6_9BILA